LLGTSIEVRNVTASHDPDVLFTLQTGEAWRVFDVIVQAVEWT